MNSAQYNGFLCSFSKCFMMKYHGTNPMEQSPSWEANSHSASQEILHLFCSLKFIPSSQEPATGSYPEPDISNVCPHTIAIQDSF